MATAGAAGAAEAASAMPPTGDREFQSGSAELTVHWVGRCHVNIEPNEFTGTWHPSLNLRVVEEGQTAWKWVKLAYKYRTSDETFIVLEGVLRIDFRDGTVQVSAGEMFVVPKGVEHKPYAEHEVKLMLIEPRGVLNTGHEGGGRTAQNDVWI